MSSQAKNNAALVDDSQRAANTKFKISNAKQGSLNLLLIALDDLITLVEKYRQRTYTEDLMYIEELGGNRFH
jgi:hypothetical protein